MSDNDSNFHFLVQQNKALAEKLGQAIWAFALVERATYRYMKKLSTDALDVLMADQPIPVRIADRQKPANKRHSSIPQDTHSCDSFSLQTALRSQRCAPASAGPLRHLVVPTLANPRKV